MRLTTWSGTSMISLARFFRRLLRFPSLSSGDAQDMHVLALVTQKGGSGKSTLAVGLAVAAMENGERVAVIEADPQGTITKWRERRVNPNPRVDRIPHPSDLDQALSHLKADGIWLAIVD